MEAVTASCSETARARSSCRQRASRAIQLASTTVARRVRRHSESAPDGSIIARSKRLVCPSPPSGRGAESSAPSRAPPVEDEDNTNGADDDRASNDEPEEGDEAAASATAAATATTPCSSPSAPAKHARIV